MLNTEHDDSILHTVCIHSDVSSDQLIDLIHFFLFGLFDSNEQVSALSMGNIHEYEMAGKVEKVCFAL